MFEASEIIKKFREEADKKESETRALADLLFTQGHQGFYAGMLSTLLTIALAAYLYKSPTITEDRFVEAGETFTAPARSIVSGEMSRDLMFGIGYQIHDGDPTSGEMYFAIEEPVPLRANSKGYVRTLRQREIPRDVVEKTIEWQAATSTFCKDGCNSVNISHNQKFLDMIPEVTFRNLRGRYRY
jgi:hypothetical protein